MYDSSMKSDTYPLAMPTELLNEVRQTAHETGLSVADAMRQSMKLGLPKLREQLSPGSLRPLTAKEVKAAFKRDKEWEAFEFAMTKHSQVSAGSSRQNGRSKSLGRSTGPMDGFEAP
jgi:hypothetical protein